jgi:hypothetical protein
MLIASKFCTHKRNKKPKSSPMKKYSQVLADEGILAKVYSQIDKGSYQRCEACNTMIFWGDQSLKQRNPYRSYIRSVIKPCTYSTDNSISHALFILCLR